MFDILGVILDQVKDGCHGGVTSVGDRMSLPTPLPQGQTEKVGRWFDPIRPSKAQHTSVFKRADFFIPHVDDETLVE